LTLQRLIEWGRLPLRFSQLWLSLALLAYYLPWTVHPAAAFTLNANDLAEWISLHPAVRGGSPPLVGPFLLRIVLAGMAVLWACYATRPAHRMQRSGLWQKIAIVMALILGITLMPPLGFFRGAGDDPNYQQQFMISLGTMSSLIVLTAIWNRFCERARWLFRVLNIGIPSLGVIAGMVGLISAMDTVRSVGLTVGLGPGLPALIFALSIYGVAEFEAARKPSRA